MIKLVRNAKEFFEKGQIGQAYCYWANSGRDGIVDGNGDKNGQGGVAEVADLTQGHPIDPEDNLWDDIMASNDEVQAVDSDDDSFEDDSSSDYKEYDNYSVVDEDELFEYSSEDKIDMYERMYADGTMWAAEGDGEVVLKEGDIYMIKSISEKYSCAKTQYNPAASADWISKKLYEDVRVYPSMLVKSMAKLLMMRHGVLRDLQGIIIAIETMFPRAFRRICVVHFQRKILKAFQGPKLKALMMRACHAYNAWTHRKAMEALHNLSAVAYNYLLDEPKENWCRHLFPTFTKSDDNTTNFVETLNNVLNMVRDKPIYNLLEEISSTLIE
ncbi:hypothetical protein Cgig2_024272 [Carnegiea gigantea]|uniref:MULE transposase domain-containing protein n=1 Tax=Carnegiea gigantea TaxID=171969 RepID=A0A9Q1JW22_9CARY|nr:hypothetical protein Cgig2_024272 [Carnegiea gigantea]